MESRPFLKWAGGKWQLLPELLDRIHEPIRNYYEPFAGGGALLLHLQADAEKKPGHAILSDLNSSLIDTYDAVANHPTALLKRLTSLQKKYLEGVDRKDREKVYYDIRDQRPTDLVETAARFIFLNKTCYNGLYRENRQGVFNVPHGSYENPLIADSNAITSASKLLRGVTLQNGDFALCAGARGGDFVYFDPPFHPVSATSSFNAYTSHGFGMREQERLHDLAARLHKRGVRVMISNSTHPAIQRLWDDGTFSVETVLARRAINSRGDKRGPIGELLITNFEAPSTKA